MLRLVKVCFDHYSQKDSESGQKALLVVPDGDDKAVMDWMVAEGGDSESLGVSPYWDDFEYDDEDDDEDDWQEFRGLTKKEVARGRAIGLKVTGPDDWKDWRVEGDRLSVILFRRGDQWAGVEDAYYGVTHWWWEWGEKVTEDETLTLVRLGLALRVGGE